MPIASLHWVGYTYYAIGSPLHALTLDQHNRCTTAYCSDLTRPQQHHTRRWELQVTQDLRVISLPTGIYTQCRDSEESLPRIHQVYSDRHRANCSTASYHGWPLSVAPWPERHSAECLCLTKCSCDHIANQLLCDVAHTHIMVNISNRSMHLANPLY